MLSISDIPASRPHSPFGALTDADIDFIHRLWDELVEFPARDIDGAVEYLMTSLGELADAQNVVWVGAVRMADCDQDIDPFKGWRTAHVETLRPGKAMKDHLKAITRTWDRLDPDPSFLVAVKEAGKFRVHSFRRDLPADWFESPFYRTHWQAIHVYDAVFVGFPLNQDAESHFGFHRMVGQSPFSEVEIARLAYALRGIKWFHNRLMLSHGLMLASSPLTPSERRVLRMLSTDSSEKEIARDLELATATLHHYVKSIFRKFGVRSRAGLMGLWLGKPT